MLCLLISRKPIYLFLLLSSTVVFKWLFDNTNLINGRFCHLGWLQPLGFSHNLLNSHFLCQCKGFHVITYFSDILVWTHSKCNGKRAWSFLCSLLVHLGLHISFLKLVLHLIWQFSFFQDYVGIQWSCPYLYHLTNFLRYSSLLILCYRCNPLQSIRLCPF